MTANRILVFLLIPLFCISCNKSSIYVAENGNDQNSGSSSKPVASVQKAIELSRAGKIKKVIIREGKYYDVSVNLTIADSGLVIEGEPHQQVNLYGGKKIANWKQVGDWFVADAIGTRDRSWDFRILIVNDSLRSRARLPANGSFQHESKWPYEWQSSQGGWSKKPTYEDLTTMIYNPKDLGSWLDVRNAELTIFHNWDDSYVGLQRIDTVKNILTFTYPATHPAGAFAPAAERANTYYVWNIKEGMKHPGQWYLDRTSEKIFYWPYPYEKISDIEALAPTKNQIFTFDKGVRNITLENLKMSCAGAPMSNTGYATTEIEGCIQGDSITNVTFNNITIKNTSGWAIKIGGSNIAIADCEFYNTAAGGIKFHGNNIQLERCGIHDVGKMYFGAVGIHGEGKYNKVSHCELYNIPYAAINGLGKNSLAEYNLIYNFKLELQDGGAIYCYGGDSTVYRNNATLFKNGNTITGWTYYFDELSKSCIIENNFALNSLTPVHNHMANEIIVRNNLFIDQGKQKINSFLCSNLHFAGNTFVADTVVFAGPTGEPLSKDKASYNLIFQKFYDANGIVEFKDNKLYCDKILREVLFMYDNNRTENFDPPQNTHISDKNERILLMTNIPEAYKQTGYRGNFEEVYKEMTSIQ